LGDGRVLCDSRVVSIFFKPLDSEHGDGDAKGLAVASTLP